MRSGNKVSFKNMGSSPAKQSVAPKDDGLINPSETTAGKDFLAKQQAIKLQRENEEAAKTAKDAKTPEAIAKKEEDAFKSKGAYSATNREGNTLDDLRTENVRKEKEGRLNDGDKNNDYDMGEWDATSGLDYDPDLGHYKSKTQLSEEKKTRNLQTKTDAKNRKNTSKENDVTERRKFLGIDLGERKYTKAERKADKKAKQEQKHTDKNKTLTDRLAHEKGTGKSGFSFSLKNALLGDNIASGLSYGARHKNTQKTIDKRAKNKKSEATKQRGKENRKNIK